MAIALGINKSSLMAQRRLGEATDANSKISEQLSSGLRINRASDDAAGLAIASSLNSTSKVYAQGIRNLNDGISLLSVADSAVNALSDITIRLKELATQASNGTYSSTQRSALDSEAQALSKEYTRIIQSTKFNNISVLSGDLSSGLRLQAGYGTDGGIASGLGGVQGTGVFTQTFSNNNNTGLKDVALGDIDNDGNLDMLTIGTAGAVVRRGDGDGGFGSTTTLNLTGTGYKSSFADMNNDGNLDVVSISSNSGTAYTNINLGNGDGTFGATLTTTIANSATHMSGLAISDIDNDGKMDVLSYSEAGSVYVQKGNGSGGLSSATTITTLAQSAVPNAGLGNYLQVADVNNDGNSDILVINKGATSAQFQVRLGDGAGSFAAAITTTISASGSTSGAAFAIGDVDGDGKLDVVTGLGSAVSMTFFKGNGNGTFATGTTAGSLTATAYSLELSDINGDSFLDLISLNFTSGVLGVRTGRGDGTFNAATSTLNSTGGGGFAIGDIDNDGANDVLVGLTDDGSVRAHTNITREANSSILSFSLKTRSDAKLAQTTFSRKLDELSLQRGRIGAFQSRTSVAVNSLTSMRDEYKTAEARISDLDVASAAGDYVRTKILQEAATSVLAQANQSPALSLKLLQDI